MNNFSKLVDVGCGTGVATMQLATMFPSAKIYGLDLSEVPDAILQMAPENITWVVGDVLNAKTASSDQAYEYYQRSISQTNPIFTPGGLDYIFGRMLFLGINDWTRYFSTAMQSLRPGGIIEHQDLDWGFYRAGTAECLSHEWEWHNHVISAAQNSGLSDHAGSDAARLMQEAGLEVVSVQEFEFSFVQSDKTPPNSVAMSKYVQAKLLPQYPELLRKMLGNVGIAGEALQKLTEEALHDLTSKEGLYQKYTVTIGRKL
ncbi:MAG: hypothetical protein L6R41_002645 [Letrouitia leprolyta]|nr:MAG: hypothetical protein L6R41_002645 [Letrouitia leprolyta]